jgi:drug/metabolite transporter (DMT)-like permease
MMTLAMALFAVADALIKTLGETVPAAQIVWMLGVGGFVSFASWFWATGRGIWSPDYLKPGVLLRSGFEAGGTMFVITALTLVPLALVSAVIQATPLVVALGAAVFFRNRVGWRRWAAILVGFGGVLLIVRPGSAAVEVTAWLAVAGMLGLAGRDLMTRALPATITGPRLSLHAFATLTVSGVVLQAAQGAPLVGLDPGGALIMTLCVAFGSGAYLAIVAATRLGDISVVSSFRYSRMLFALAIAVPIFGERPDALMLIGVAVVIASGTFTLWREARAPSHGGTPALGDGPKH